MYPMDCDVILRDIVSSHHNLLCDNLVGIYVHGSIALQCFSWEHSDIDYIVVVRQPLSIDCKVDLIREILRISETAPPKGLEISVVLEPFCRDFVYPTPFDLHYSNYHKSRYEQNIRQYCIAMSNGHDRDLAAHFTIIKHAGIPLFGPPVDAVFGEVPRASYWDSIRNDVLNAREEINLNHQNQMYYILNFCRILAYQAEGLIVSKQQGALWGLERLDPRFHNLIRAALTWYVANQPPAIDESMALEFCDQALAWILR